MKIVRRLQPKPISSGLLTDSMRHTQASRSASNVDLVLAAAALLVATLEAVAEAVALGVEQQNQNEGASVGGRWNWEVTPSAVAS